LTCVVQKIENLVQKIDDDVVQMIDDNAAVHQQLLVGQIAAVSVTDFLVVADVRVV